MEELLRFIPQIYNIDVSFFVEMYKRKLYQYKLKERRVIVNGLNLLNGILWLDSYSFEDDVCRFPTCERVSSNMNDRFDAEERLVNDKVVIKYENDKCRCNFVQGLLVILDSLEEFRSVDKESIITEFICYSRFKDDKHLFDIKLNVSKTLDRATLLGVQKFVLFVYIDFKHHSCHYSISNPSIYPKSHYYYKHITENKNESDGNDIIEAELLQLVDKSPSSPLMFYIKSRRLLSTDLFKLTLIDDGSYTFDNESIDLEKDLHLLTFNSIDCNIGLNRCWSNLLLLLTLRFKLFSKDLNIIVINQRRKNSLKHFRIKLPNEDSFVNPSLSYGFKCSQSNSFPKFEHFQPLSELIDPGSLSKISEELHLQLMTWRILPEFTFQSVAKLKICIIGVGSLGCSIIRQLLSWGISDYVLVDHGVVTNSTRQSLFLYNDYWKFKVDVAAEMIRSIRPDVSVEPLKFKVPMPGHLTSDKELENGIITLEKIMDECDIVVLSTDSKESRWLPSLIGATKNYKKDANVPLIISAGLSFDSCMIIRHSYSNFKGSCYFCCDEILTNTITGRPIDETCTIVKPGTIATCASLTVELLMSLLQHPLKFSAPHDSKSCIGNTPQSIRLSLSDYKISQLYGERCEYCICCSNKVIEAHINDKLFIKRVFEDTRCLTEISGLSSMLKGCEEYDIKDEDKGFYLI